MSIIAVTSYKIEKYLHCLLILYIHSTRSMPEQARFFNVVLFFQLEEARKGLPVLKSLLTIVGIIWRVVEAIEVTSKWPGYTYLVLFLVLLGGLSKEALKN